MQFPFGRLAPDALEMEPGICMVADGVLPLRSGYGPYPGLSESATATALSAAPRGMLSYTKADGSWAVVAGTETTIEEKASDDTWSSIGTGFTSTEGDDWCMARFGTKLLATNTTDGLNAYDVETPAGFGAVAAAGDPRWIFECGNMLFGLDCLDRSSARDNRLIRSSKFSDHTAWTGVGTDYQPLESGGALIWGGKLSDTSALVLQERAVKLIQVGNVGGGALWGLQSVAEEFGSSGAKSCVNFDGMVFWFATDGFRKFSLGGGIEQIGAGLVDQWFLDRVDQSDLSLIQASIDPFRKCVLWRYKRTDVGASVIFEDIIGYNWQWKRWFTLDLDTTYLSYTAEPASTYDAYSGTYDAATTTYDARTLQGGQPQFGVLNSTFVWNTFSGSNLAATLTTATSNSPVTGLIGWATPIDDAAAGTLELGVKDQTSDSITWKTAASKVSAGRVPLRGRGTNIAFRYNVAAGADWSYARGVDHIVAATGGPR